MRIDYYFRIASYNAYEGVPIIVNMPAVLVTQRHRKVEKHLSANVLEKVEVNHKNVRNVTTESRNPAKHARHQAYIKTSRPTEVFNF
jgi:BioD-like phosphotransacetylase family protein